MPEVLCLYRWNEKRAKKLASWLKSDAQRYVVFLEEDPFLTLSLSHNRQLRVVAPTEPSLKQLVWELIFLPWTFEGENPYRALIEQLSTEMNYFAADYADQGITLFENLRSNLALVKHILERPDYKGIPAIICGAGPSLGKNGASLQALQDKALIFAGGAAIEALRALNVQPHFGAHIDPASLHDFSKTTLPTFYQLRAASRSLKSCEGETILCPSTGNFPLETWAQEQLGIRDEPFDGGWTVGTFCIALAHSFGCNPIILVGMDLSTQQNRHYAPGVSLKQPSEMLIPRKSQKGETLWARRDWILAAEWIERFQAHHSEVNLLNATEGGVGFKGVEEKKLKEISLETLPPPPALPLKPLLPAQPLLAIEESLARSFKFVLEILQEVEKVFPASFEGNGTIALLEYQLGEELIYQKFLQPAWQIWKHVIERSNQDGQLGLYLNELLFYQNLLKSSMYAD